ncbi:mitochondria-eating protein [Heteronotia binoei]|uniref:mitochondria-eating protein n=1 Tax=Heteronotia binoei TaxID=13085 RepID=UPI00292EA5B2|nr:mitochondria-eating protein [Heteronotia binoei]
MAARLRRLVDSESCRSLQEKLEKWQKDYDVRLLVRAVIYIRQGARREPPPASSPGILATCKSLTWQASGDQAAKEESPLGARSPKKPKPGWPSAQLAAAAAPLVLDGEGWRRVAPAPLGKLPFLSGRPRQQRLSSWAFAHPPARRGVMNSCDQNLNRCCEIMELSAMIQGQLFTILNQTAREGGHFAGVETIKSRLLPWLGTCFSSPASRWPFERSFSPSQESYEKERQLRELANSRNHEIQQLERELDSTRLQLSLVQQDLAEAQLALDNTKTKSATTLLAAEDEIVQLKADLKASQAKEECTLRNLEQLNDYERQVQMLKDEIAILGAQKSVLQSRLARSRSPSPRSVRSRSPSPLPVKSISPARTRLSDAFRHAQLVERFRDIYAQERLSAQTLLKSYIDDLEMVQRIIYVAAVESFRVAKKAFRQFKTCVRKTLSGSYSEPDSLEDTVMDYIIRQEDLYDVQSSVREVIRAVNLHPQISCPPEVDLIMISSLVRELCRVAFSMQTLDPPLDILFAVDGELFNEHKYRRSYDSDFTAPLVAYHIWPALMEDHSVMVKGEVVTRRGALWSHRSRSRSRGRSQTRNRSSSPLCHSRLSPSRSRSPSPLRSGSPSK